MASTDARPVPRKNTAFRITFPVYDADGDPVTSATGLDSEVSLDGAAFADCTNEATEIGNGLYYLDLTSAEMNADTVAVVVKTSTSGAKTVAAVLYPAATTELPSVSGILASAVEGSRTLQESLRLMMAALLGKVSGAGTSSISFRDAADTKDRINATVDDDGNRSTVTLDAS